MNYCDKGFLKGLFRKGKRLSMSGWDIEKRGVFHMREQHEGVVRAEMN